MDQLRYAFLLTLWLFFATYTALIPQQQPGNKVTLKRWPYQVLGIPITHDVLPKWMENKEVLYQLGGDVKPPLQQTKVTL